MLQGCCRPGCQSLPEEEHQGRSQRTAGMEVAAQVRARPRAAGGSVVVGLAPEVVERADGDCR